MNTWVNHKSSTEPTKTKASKRQSFRNILVLTGLLLVLSACQSEQQILVEAKIPEPRMVQKHDPETLQEMLLFFDAMDYDWNSLDNGVPPIILKSFPGDLNNNVQITKKKRSFFLALLPMVLLANEVIMEERRYLLDTFSRHENSQTLAEDDQQKLERLVRKYRLRGNPLRDHRLRTHLMKRIDIIPPSLVLAQAANESAWGTSRFARLGNNLFGQWTFKPGTGIVPEGRPDGATYEVQRFKSLYASVNSYMLNLNTHSAYRQLRDIRARMRQQKLPVTGKALAEGLTRYSTKGEEYVDEIRSMIRQNQLSILNDLSLRVPSTDIMNGPKIAGNGLLSTQRQIGVRLSEAWKNPKS